MKLNGKINRVSSTVTCFRNRVFLHPQRCANLPLIAPDWSGSERRTLLTVSFSAWLDLPATFFSESPSTDALYERSLLRSPPYTSEPVSLSLQQGVNAEQRHNNGKLRRILTSKCRCRNGRHASSKRRMPLLSFSLNAQRCFWKEPQAGNNNQAI